MQKPNYRIYPSLLDAFQYYLSSDFEDGFQKMIDKINRVPFFSEAADKGTKFNELIDRIIEGYRNNDHVIIGAYETMPEDGKCQWNGYEFKAKIVRHFVEFLKGSRTQVFSKALIETPRGIVELYGYIDNLKYGSPTDIKTTGSYDFPKFLHNWQHIVYPYCLIHGDGVQPDAAGLFTYEVTDFNNIYREQYVYDEERDLKRLRAHIVHFIDFVEKYRDLITDNKLFALDEPKEAIPAERG